jgi:hypothetical protein
MRTLVLARMRANRFVMAIPGARTSISAQQQSFTSTTNRYFMAVNGTETSHRHGEFLTTLETTVKPANLGDRSRHLSP